LSKDQAIGGAILLVCVVIAILYVATLFFPEWLGLLGLNVTGIDVRFWVVAVPVFIAIIAITGIGAWIGLTMATTPPPKPIEEIKSEIEEKSDEEEKKTGK
jgi:predicted DNA-binding transcriptional regulator